MIQKAKKLYKVSEFASLCGVTRHTLYHYDEIGLLSPSVVKPNGYRYYTPEQYSRFAIISVLKKTGSSLEEIKEYLAKKDNRTFLSVLNQKLSELKAEAAKLEAMCGLLSNAISEMEHNLEVKTDELEIRYCEKEYLIATPLEGNLSTNDSAAGTSATGTSSADDSAADTSSGSQAMFQSFGSHFRYCTEHSLPIGLHIGDIVLQKDIENGIFKESYYYSRLTAPAESDRLFVKPEGYYAIMYHQGSYDRLEEVYCHVIKRLSEAGCRVAGNLYEEDVIDYLSENNPERYLCRIEVQVEKAANGFPPPQTPDGIF